MAIKSTMKRDTSREEGKETDNAKVNILLSNFLIGIVRKQIRFSDTQLLIVLPILLLLILYQFPHPTGIPSPVKINRYHHSINQQDEAAAEDDNEVGFSVCVKDGDCVCNVG